MGIFDWLLGKKSKDKEEKDVGIEKGEDLITAAGEGDTKTAEMLLTKGARVNAKSKDGKAALLRAAWEGLTETVEMLLTKGADVNAKDEVGAIAL